MAGPSIPRPDRVIIRTLNRGERPHLALTLLILVAVALATSALSSSAVASRLATGSTSSVLPVPTQVEYAGARGVECFSSGHIVRT